MDENSYDHFTYALANPLRGEKRWMLKLESLVTKVPPENECIIWVYVFERMNFRLVSLRNLDP